MMKLNYRFLRLLASPVVIFMIVTSFTEEPPKDCGDAKDYAESAYDYFRKAYHSDNLEDAQYYSKKGMTESSSAEDESDDSECDCDDAESSASDAYSYGKKAYQSEDLEDAQYYAKKAMNSAEEITSEAEDCEEE